MDNMRVWNKVNRPPKEALKKITGGRLSGMTDINPQWRYEIMTEVFGPIGVGWYYEIDDVWIEDGAENQKVAFAKVKLYTKTEDDTWSRPIPGIGGSMLISKERNGLHTNDEAYKMAVTDALSVAMKALGVAADIYKGLWDGSKYRATVSEKGSEKLNKEQVEQINDMLLWSSADQGKFLDFVQVKRVEDIPQHKYDQLMGMLEAKGQEQRKKDEDLNQEPG